jgi:hypothetical protein
MERVRASGLTDVAKLLHKMADDIETGAISIGDRVVHCSRDLTAIVNPPVNSEDEVHVVTLQLCGAVDLRRPLIVEEELSHPGG